MPTTFTQSSFLWRCSAHILALLLLPLLGWGQASIVISQVYGGGGNTGASYNRDFVELHNTSSSSQSLAGLSVQYASAAGTTWSSVSLSGSIAAGGYYLISGTSGTAGTGRDLPTPEITGLPNLAAGSGKVALISGTNGVSVACPTANLIDLVGYGSSTLCFEGTVTTGTSDNGIAVTRKNNGCTDTNSNGADFTLVAVAPHNSATTVNICATNPTITSFTPTSGPVNTVVTLTGTGFTGATAVKFNGATAASFSVTDASTLVATVAAATTTGIISVTTPGGTATSAANFTVTATPTTFYAKASGALNLPTSFGANTDGSGAAPVDFSVDNTSYVINGASRSLTGNWVITGTGSKAVLAANASLIIPPSYTLTGGLDQAAGSTLIIQNSSPTAYTNIKQGVQDASSTIDFAQAGDYTLPVLPTTNGFALQNLKLTNGTKTFARDANASTNGTVVPGNLTLDATVVAGATTTSTTSRPSTIALRGNLTLLSGTSFLPASSSKIALNLLAATPQTLTGNGSDIILLELDALTAGGGAILSTTGGSTNLELGNLSSRGGGYYLETGSSLLLNGNNLRFTAGGNGFIYTGASGAGKGTVTPAATSSINLETTSTVIGSLLLTPGAITVQDFRLACVNGELPVPSDLTINGLLTLTDGAVALAPGHTLTLNGTTTRINGTLKGSAMTDLVIGGTGALGSLAFKTGSQQVNNLTLNRLASGVATLGSPLTVSGTLTLTAGLLATDATNVLTLPAAATVTGGSGSSFVSGPLVRPLGPVSSASSYIFPVGKGAAYRPFTLNITTQTGTTYYWAEQLEGRPNPSALASPDASGTDLVRVGRARFFTLSPFAAAPDAAAVITQPAGFAGSVTLTFGPDDGVNAPNDPGLVVAKRANSSAPWANFGNSGVTTTSAGQFASGTITSGTITSFSNFVLGATNNTNTLNPINPLPVQLTSFTANRTASGVQVAWATALEVNSASFVVERSLNGSTFERVASVAAQSNTLVGHHYTSLDRNAPTTCLYYRLRQVDLDGSVVYSPTVAVAATLGAIAELALSPNPARANISLLTELPTAYMVRTALGQAVLSGTTAGGPTTLAVAGLPTGVYFFELHTSAGRIVRRFVKE